MEQVVQVIKPVMTPVSKSKIELKQFPQYETSRQITKKSTRPVLTNIEIASQLQMAEGN